VLGCLALATVSLSGRWALAFDPQAWVVWGRDVLDGRLDTSAGPSWKPLPMLLTTPFAGAGDLAPALWLIVARAAGLLAVAGAAWLAWRLAGPAAAVGAGAAMLLSPWCAYNTALGNSEGMLAAAVLWAGVAHLDRRHAAACLLGLAAALLRPEAWPFLAAYGVWVWRHHRAARPAVVACAIVVPALWIGPDVLGVGGALNASDAARSGPTQGSASLARVPALAVLGDAATLLTLPALVAAAVAVATGGRHARVLAAGAAAWVAIVAVMTEAGYAGNPRYLVAAAAVGCVLAGVGAAALAPARWAGVTVLVAGVALAAGGELRDQLRDVGHRATLRRNLDALVSRAGGAQALRACGAPRTSLGMRAAVAWRLDVPMARLHEPPRPPGTVLRARPLSGGRAQPVFDALARRAFRRRAAVGRWELWIACQTAGARKRTVTRSKPRPRIMPSSIERVFASARRRSSGSERAASVSLRVASW
jgi:hypothetical protein